MNPIKLLSALAATAVSILLWAAPADALPRPCPAGKQWNAKGSCVKIRKATKSPEKKYQEAIKHLEGTARRPKPERAITLLKSACSSKHKFSCSLLGFLHRHGRVVKASATDSERYYKLGCRHGDPDGCVGAASLHSDGLLGRTNHKVAIPLLLRACTLNSGEGCFELANKHDKALGTSENKTEARTLYMKAVRLLTSDCPGSASACHYLGQAYQHGRGIRTDHKRAFDAYGKGCDEGSGDACTELGMAYENGRGVTLDKKRAKDAYDRGCKRFDNPQSCYWAGWLLTWFDDSARDNRAMVEYARRACDLDKKQCVLRAWIYGTGTGVSKDEREASVYYQVACDNGHAESCWVMGNRTNSGNAVPKSITRAVELWRKACEMSWAAGCRSMGNAYSDGTGVTKDLKEAYNQYHLACIRKSGGACEDAGVMVEKGTHGSRADPKHASTYYQYGCNLDTGSACHRLANLYLKGDKIAKDEAKGIELKTKGCKNEHADSCLEMGQHLYFGEHGDRDQLAASRFFVDACKFGKTKPCGWIDRAVADGKGGSLAKSQAIDGLDAACRRHNNATACVVLGNLYANGGTITGKQPRQAVSLFRERCDRGENDSCLQLGWLYSAGTGVVKDAARATQIFRRQCDKGTGGACFALGVQLWQDEKHTDAVQLFSRGCEEGQGAACNQVAFAHYTGKGTRWDIARAAELYQKSCELDYPLGCANEGELLWNGISVKKDRKKAFENYKKACTPAEASGCTWVGRSYHLGKVVGVDPDAAEKAYLRTCTGDEFASAESCFFLAALYEETGKSSPSKIAALRQQAFDLAKSNAKTNPYGEYVLGTFHELGVATVVSDAKALEHWTKGCEGFDPLSCARGGALQLEGGAGVTPDKTKAAFLLDRACAAGMPDSCGLAKTAKAGGPDKPIAGGVAPPGAKKGSSCAGCRASSGADGALLVIALVLMFGWRRRRS